MTSSSSTDERATMNTARARVDGQGRIVIPADLRRALGIKEGERVIVRLEDGELRITTIDHAIRQAQQMVRQYIPPGHSLVDELIAERRAEAARE